MANNLLIVRPLLSGTAQNTVRRWDICMKKDYQIRVLYVYVYVCICICICIYVMNDKIDGLMQERRNSIANALELRLSCTNPSIY